MVCCLNQIFAGVHKNMHCAELWQYALIFFFFLMQCVLPFVLFRNPFTCVIHFLILFVFSTFYSVREVLWDWTLWMSWWGTLWWSWCLLYGPWQLRWGKWYNIIQECKYLTVFDHLRYANQKVHYLPSAICFSVLGRYD